METQMEQEEDTMKKAAVLGVAIVLGFAGLASADSLTVTPAAAMGGTNYGLEVYHDNTDRAYVEDQTPAAETTYRATFLFNAGTVTGATGNFRQSLFRALGPNPNPGVGLCPADPDASQAFIQLWLFQVAGGTQSSLQVFGRGNQCGEQAVAASRIPISNNQDYRVCMEWQTGASLTGWVALAVTDPASACPVSGDPAWKVTNMTNGNTRIDFIRMGTPATNAFGAGESLTMFFDEFASFRTLTP
jgi:hypothetical protein